MSRNLLLLLKLSLPCCVGAIESVISSKTYVWYQAIRVYQSFSFSSSLILRKKRREELESIVDDYKRAKEHDDAGKMKIKEELDRVIKYQESCNALIKQLLATHAAS